MRNMIWIARTHGARSETNSFTSGARSSQSPVDPPPPPRRSQRVPPPPRPARSLRTEPCRNLVVDLPRTSSVSMLRRWTHTLCSVQFESFVSGVWFYCYHYAYPTMIDHDTALTDSLADQMVKCISKYLISLTTFDIIYIRFHSIGILRCFFQIKEKRQRLLIWCMKHAHTLNLCWVNYSKTKYNTKDNETKNRNFAFYTPIHERRSSNLQWIESSQVVERWNERLRGLPTSLLNENGVRFHLVAYRTERQFRFWLAASREERSSVEPRPR